MKRFLIFLIIVITLAAGFFGCSQNNQGPRPTPAATFIPYPDTEDNRDNYNNGLAMLPADSLTGIMDCSLQKNQVYEDTIFS